MTHGPGTDHEKSTVACRLCPIRQKELNPFCEQKCDDKICFRSDPSCHPSTNLSQKELEKGDRQWLSGQKNEEKSNIPAI